MPRHDPYGLAVRAYVWGFPLVAMARIRLHTTNPDDPFAPRPPTSTGAPLNRWGHQTVPADPSFRAGVGPSVDLLYSSLRLDLAGGPFVVEVPDCGSRYYTVQIAFADSSAEQSFGRRTHGAHLPPLLLRGPGDDTPIPAGMLAVDSPTRYCLLPTRFLFDPADPADLAEVRELQRQLTVRTLPDHLEGRDAVPPVPDQRRLVDPATAPPPELSFLHELGNVLRDWAVQPADRGLVASFAGIGLTTNAGFRPEQLSPSARDDVVRGLADGAEIVRRKSLSLGEDVNGWTTNGRGPRFGDDHLLRAGVAKDQIVVTVPEEALYPIARLDSEGRPLHGRQSYRISFPADTPPPVDAFWSVTLYGDDGFLVENPIDRYAISDRTPGLVRQTDGTIAIVVSARRPPSDADVNWLPAPESEFYLMLRLYIPRPEALNGAWQPPAVERVRHEAPAP
ncbi:DUF1254 domain-containing protein [Geodermatophilus sp. URMC 64]